MLDYRSIASGLLMEELKSQDLSTESLVVDQLFIGKNKESAFYNKLIGIIEYESKVYRFIYSLDKVRHMESIDELVEKIVSIAGIESSFIDYMDTNFGKKAFWDNTSINYLKEIGNESDIELRKLMNRLAKYDFGG